MASLTINPRYRDLLDQQGLVTAGDFLRLSGIIYCGHPDRNVSRVTVGEGPAAVTAFLKKEHRVRWRERLASAWAGFGFVSRSRRELAVSSMLEQAGIAAPEVIAAGEEGRQAFVLLRAVDNAHDLRWFLQHTTDPARRCQLARQLGEALAQIHAAGIDHPDLYSKHVLVQPLAGECKLWFLDWQRSRRRHVSWSLRCRDLAALDASLADTLASPRERLRCLQAYVRRHPDASSLASLARHIRRKASSLLRRRHVRELRQEPLRPGQQNLVWLDGEELCVTSEFREELHGKMPAWLALQRPATSNWDEVEHQQIPLAPKRSVCLVRRRQSRPWHWLWSCLRRRPLSSPELYQAGALFRLQRYGIASPRLLAVGQRRQRPWRTESFLLTEPLPATAGLADWLGKGQDFGENLRDRRHVLQHAGEVLRRIHEAGYSFAASLDPRRLWVVQANPEQKAQVVLTSVEGLCRSRKLKQVQALEDFRKLRRSFVGLCSRTEQLRFLLGYLDLPRLTPEGRRLVQRIMRRHRGVPLVGNRWS